MLKTVVSGKGRRQVDRYVWTDAAELGKNIVVQVQSTNQGSGAVWFDNVSLTTPTQTYGMTLPASRFGTGTQHVLARATDNTNDTSDLKSAQFEVFSSSPPPTIASLDIDDDSVEIGSDITLTANDVADVDGIIEQVHFYRDANHNGTLEVGTDQLVGTSNQGTQLVVNGGFESGTGNWTNMSTANHASTLSRTTRGWATRSA
jgi:hypothetical protein